MTTRRAVHGQMTKLSQAHIDTPVDNLQKHRPASSFVRYLPAISGSAVSFAALLQSAAWHAHSLGVQTTRLSIGGCHNVARDG